MNTAEHIVLAKPEVLCSSGSPGGGSYDVASSKDLARAFNASFDGGAIGADGAGADDESAFAIGSVASGEPHADVPIVNRTAAMTFFTRRFYTRAVQVLWDGSRCGRVNLRIGLTPGRWRSSRRSQL